ncbi:hypothetical protein PLICBS_005213 [Purpureocillium lilacinum]|uniref:uncharacterized protein n=1 Tax=Purpureocillium lilacinum TaxID=33203 RepID=UPI0020807706|nr:hypothetical protein PLICBS_005213 [Purpureocillium lilacinum]
MLVQCMMSEVHATALVINANEAGRRGEEEDLRVQGITIQWSSSVENEGQVIIKLMHVFGEGIEGFANVQKSSFVADILNLKMGQEKPGSPN